MNSNVNNKKTTELIATELITTQVEKDINEISRDEVKIDDETEKLYGEINVIVTRILSSLLKLNKNFQYNDMETNEIIKDLKKLNSFYNERGAFPYSFTTDFIYELKNEQPEKFSTNVTRLCCIVHSHNSELKIVVDKLYHYCHLAMKQSKLMHDPFEKFVADEIEKEKQKEKKLSEELEKFKNELQNSQKNNVTILGIFTSIVATFFGLSTFSASILNNIMDVNFYKLITVSCVIGLFFYATIKLFIDFILQITGKKIIQKTEQKKDSGTESGNEGEKTNSNSQITILVSLIIIAIVCFIAAFLGVPDPFSNCLNL